MGGRRPPMRIHAKVRPPWDKLSVKTNPAAVRTGCAFSCGQREIGTPPPARPSRGGSAGALHFSFGCDIIWLSRGGETLPN